MISSHLTRQGYRVVTAGNGPDALKGIVREKPDLVILDVLMPGMDGYQVCQELRKNASTVHLPIILLTTRGGVSDRIAGLQAGADDYVTKPFDLRELTLRVQALLARAVKPKTPHKARVITFFSLKGGVGVTTLTVNVAVSLARMWLCKVALADLAVSSGHVPVLLNLFPTYTLSELAREEPEDIPSELISRYLVEHESGIHILAAPKSAAMAEDLSPRLVNAFMPPLQENYDYVLIDTMHAFNDATMTAIEHTDLLMLVVTPTMPSLKAANDALTILESIGFSQKRIIPVLNEMFAQPSLRKEDMERALGTRLLATIPHERRQALEAVNRGTPLVMRAPNSPTTMAIEMLAYRLSTPEMREEIESERSEILARIRKALP